MAGTWVVRPEPKYRAKLRSQKPKLGLETRIKARQRSKVCDSSQLRIYHLQQKTSCYPLSSSTGPVMDPRSAVSRALCGQHLVWCVVPQVLQPINCCSFRAVGCYCDMTTAVGLADTGSSPTEPRSRLPSTLVWVFLSFTVILSA